MSKYAPLWDYIRTRNEKEFSLTFEEIQAVLGFSIDHSFLTYKKELLEYGYQVGKISIKGQTVMFHKNG